MNGRAAGTKNDWRYLPYIYIYVYIYMYMYIYIYVYIYGLFFRPKFQGISPQNMVKNMVEYLHFRILEFPLI